MRKAEKVVLFELLDQCNEQQDNLAQLYGEDSPEVQRAMSEAHGIRRAIGALNLYPEFLAWIVGDFK